MQQLRFLRNTNPQQVQWNPLHQRKLLPLLVVLLFSQPVTASNTNQQL
jgi:hypothetical protein